MPHLEMRRKCVGKPQVRCVCKSWSILTARYKFSGQLSRFVKSCVNAMKTQKLEAMKTHVENDTGCYEDPELGGSCTQVLDYSKSKH